MQLLVKTTCSFLSDKSPQLLLWGLQDGGWSPERPNCVRSWGFQHTPAPLLQKGPQGLEMEPTTDHAYVRKPQRASSLRTHPRPEGDARHLHRDRGFCTWDSSRPNPMHPFICILYCALSQTSKLSVLLRSVSCSII